jgi:hypothetical protein
MLSNELAESNRLTRGQSDILGIERSSKSICLLKFLRAGAANSVDMSNVSILGLLVWMVCEVMASWINVCQHRQTPLIDNVSLSSLKINETDFGEPAIPVTMS